MQQVSTHMQCCVAFKEWLHDAASGKYRKWNVWKYGKNEMNLENDESVYNNYKDLK